MLGAQAIKQNRADCAGYMSLVRSVAFQSLCPSTGSHAYLDPQFEPLIHGQWPVAEVSPGPLALQPLHLFRDLALGLAADVLAPPCQEPSVPL
jgi:hypothetical protein